MPADVLQQRSPFSLVFPKSTNLSSKACYSKSAELDNDSETSKQRLQSGMVLLKITLASVTRLK